MIKLLLAAALAASARADAPLAAAYQNAADLFKTVPALAVKLRFEKGFMKVVSARVIQVPPNAPTEHGSMRVEIWKGNQVDSSYAIPDPLGYGHVELPDGTHGTYTPENAETHVYVRLTQPGLTKVVVVPLSSGTRAVGGEIELKTLLATACADFVKAGATKPAGCP